MEESSAWELSKENIQPLKQGRQPSILSKALRMSTNVSTTIDGQAANESASIPASSSTNMRTLILQQEKEEFENNLKTCMQSSDPLAVYYRYIRWIEETHPAGKEKEIRDLVNKCLTSLRDHVWMEKYTNDIRYLYIWLKFASFSKNMGSHTVYEFMLNNGHCVGLAGFYMQWASELEANGHLNEAAKIYQKGVQNKAQPAATLATSYEEFQARLARRMMEEGQTSDGDETDATRNVLGVLKAIAPRRTIANAPATTPYMRQSNLEEVKCGKPIAPPSDNRRTAFAIFDEATDQENAPAHSRGNANRMTIANIPTEKQFCKENAQDADVWTRAKIQQASFVKKPIQQQSKPFQIFVDEPSSISMMTVDKSRAGLETSLKSSKAQFYTPDGGLFMCCMDQLYDGANERSIEEIRAARWQPKKISEDAAKTPAVRQSSTATTSVTPGFRQLSTAVTPASRPPTMRPTGLSASTATTPGLRPFPSTTPFSNRAVLTPVVDQAPAAAESIMKKLEPISWKNPTPSAPSPPGNSSFTQCITREAMAAFSNTLHLSGIGHNATTEIDDDHLPRPSRLSMSSAVVPKGNVGGGGFVIFEDDENSENAQPVPKEEADKENIDPLPRINAVAAAAAACSNGPIEKKRRNVAGILCPSTEFPCFDERNKDDVIIVEEDVVDEHHQQQQQRSNLAPFPNPAASATLGNHTYDFNESTVAGFQRFLPLHGNRAFSTPCQNVSRIQPLSLSSYRPLDLGDTIVGEDTGNHAAIIAEHAAANKIREEEEEEVAAATTDIDAGSKTAVTGQKLSAIAETSREYVSSSSSGSSAGGNTRRRLLSGTSGLQSMPSISEDAAARNRLAFGTPFSDAVFGTVLTGASDDGLSKSAQKPTAVRKLLVDENEPQNGGATMPGAIMQMAVNPWNQAFIDYQLDKARRLDSYPNYHTFDEKMPSMKAGRTSCLGGETYLILGVAGEGAYAQVFKCDLENEEGDFALKVQKPCCPIEFYICQELYYRLKMANVLSVVERGLTTFRDAYMFADGSILVGEFSPYGTLLDLVNIYKQNTAEKCLPEVMVAAITADVLRIFEAVHSQHIIHGDVKPDNFLVLGTPWCAADKSTTPKCESIRLIDWGRSIDMTLMPPAVTFFGKSNTSGFICCEMQDGRPYTYQTDYYGILGTVHILAFGDYMNTHKVQATNRWRISKSFKRRWDDRLWREFFDTFLNVPDCSSLPSLTEWRQRFDDFVRLHCNMHPSSWPTETKKMQDLLRELKLSMAKKKKLM